jgi:hypothetical protein
MSSQEETLRAEDILGQRTVNIAGTDLIVACSTNGIRYVSISAVCKTLDIDPKAQARRIKNILPIQTHLRQLPLHTSGGVQLVKCLPVENIISWLSHLLPTTVKKPYQSRLQHYQQELVNIVNTVYPSPSSVAELEHQEATETIFPLQDSQALTTIVVVDNREDSQIEVPQRILQAPLPTSSETRLLIPLYYHEEHTAFREASLSKTHRWTYDEENLDDPHFISTTKLEVYMSRPSEPIGIAAAMQRIQQLGPSTVLTARIAFGLWNIRRNDPLYSENGWVGIEVYEFLALRGIKMHSRAISSTSDARISDGYYEKKYIQQVQHELELLQGCHIRRWVTLDNYYDSPYLRVSLLMHRNKKRGPDQMIRVAVSPGEWMPSTLHHAFHRFSKIDERIFQLNLQYDLTTIFIGLYLSERWRHQALQATSRVTEANDPWEPYREPISMQDLLEASVIEIDWHNLTSRFFERIETAFHLLFKNQILGTPAQCLTNIDKSRNWGKAWLASQWLLLPSLDPLEGHHQLLKNKSGDDVYQLSLIAGPVEKKSQLRHSKSRKSREQAPPGPEHPL